jgi:hypothetical protein
MNAGFRPSFVIRERGHSVDHAVSRAASWRTLNEMSVDHVTESQRRDLGGFDAAILV